MTAPRLPLLSRILTALSLCSSATAAALAAQVGAAHQDSVTLALRRLKGREHVRGSHLWSITPAGRREVRRRPGLGLHERDVEAETAGAEKVRSR